MDDQTVLIGLLLLGVAFIYSTVGHGGASGYLAILSFFAFSPAQLATSALILNLLVAGTAWIAYSQSRYFSLSLVLPFLVTSIPFAFIGGSLKIPSPVYGFLLALALPIAAFRLALPNGEEAGTLATKTPPWLVSLLAGSIIGLLSGIVGIGGGIFLSPLFLVFHWATAKQTSAASAFFILFNSISGLFGRGFTNQLDISLVFPFLLPAFLGGFLGSRLGANQFSSLTLRRILALVLLIAAFKAFRMGMVPGV